MTLQHNDDSVQTHLNILQGVINRMANNSVSCKTWCVTLVSAVLVLSIDKLKPEALVVGILPVLMFLFLDAYYLTLERDFWRLYNSFVEKLRKNEATSADIYLVRPRSGIAYRIGKIVGSIFSWSIFPFYGGTVVILLVIKYRGPHIGF